jgi:type IV secretory pathway component VirB8
MNNQYISRYAKHDTHFHRTDKWQLASFAEEEKASPLWIAAGIIGIGAILIGMVAL